MDVSRIIQRSSDKDGGEEKADGPSGQRMDVSGGDDAASTGGDSRVSSYAELQRAVQGALESESRLSTSDKVALALEVLRARQLELDLAQTKNNIEYLVSSQSMAPRSLRAVIPSSTVKGLPVGATIEIRNGRFTLSPTTNDPNALFLTLELQSYGQQTDNDEGRTRE